MGSGYSQHDYNMFAADLYRTAMQNPCLLPDIGIDESLMKYSYINSHTALQSFSNQLVSSVPGFIDRLGSRLGTFTPIPNAVGLGALVVSMIMEICIHTSSQTNNESYDMLRRVFGEEKASSVRDTMSEYLKRHQAFITDQRQILAELQTLGPQLSHQLTILRNSLLYDGQMSNRGMKMWVNGASFHIQMMIHQARLKVQNGDPASGHVHSINAIISQYLQDLDHLLHKYKTYTGALNMKRETSCGKECSSSCLLWSDRCQRVHHEGRQRIPCEGSRIQEAFMNHLVEMYEPSLGLKNHFITIRNNLHAVIHQHASFTVA